MFTIAEGIATDSREAVTTLAREEQEDAAYLPQWNPIEGKWEL
jgi:hypothetical protein